MGRPKKLATELRRLKIDIPVTAAEKALIMEAGGMADPSGYTSWARNLLTREATKTLKAKNADREPPS